MNVIYYIVNTQFRNTGDILIAKSLINSVKAYGQVVIDDSDVPEIFLSTIMTTGVTKLSALAPGTDIIAHLFQRMRGDSVDSKTKYFLFMPPGDLSRRGRTTALSLLLVLPKLFILAKRGCRIVRIGVSFNSFDLANKVMMSIFSRAHFKLGVRDQSSILFAKSNFFSKVNFVPDLSWCYDGGSQKNEELRSDYIVVSFRAISNEFSDFRDRNRRIVDIILSILQSYRTLRVIVTYQVLYDRPICRDIFDRIKKSLGTNNSGVDFIDSQLDIEEAFSIYRHARFVLSNRLHVLLMSIQQMTPAFPVIYKDFNKKIYATFIENDLSNHIIDAQLKEESSLRIIEDVLKDNFCGNQKYVDAIKSNRSIISGVLNELFK